MRHYAHTDGQKILVFELYVFVFVKSAVSVFNNHYSTFIPAIKVTPILFQKLCINMTMSNHYSKCLIPSVIAVAECRVDIFSFHLIFKLIF